MGEDSNQFSTGRLTRTLEIPYYETQRRRLHLQATWLGRLFHPNYGVRIYDMDLAEDWVLIENTSRAPQYMSHFTLCDEERRNKLSFPEDLVVEPNTFLKVVCSPGRASSLDIYDEQDGRTALLMWRTSRGSLRSATVLREDGDCMYLLDNDDNVVSAFAKTDDGAFKEYGALNEQMERQLWRSLGLLFVVLRIVLQCTAAFFSLHTNLSSGRSTGSAHPWNIIGPLLGALVLDMMQREAVLYAHVHDFFGESLAVFSDRLGAMTIYGTLALFHGNYCGLLLAFLVLDLAACWFQLFASDCGELEIKALHGVMAQRHPRLLAFVSIASEVFLLFLFIDHGAVQYRLFAGTGVLGSAATALPGFAYTLLTAPLLTVPGVKETLLIAFMARQAMLLSQLYTCVGSMLGTQPVPCPAAAGPKSFLLRALMERNGPNIELLRNSESLQTLRSQN